MSEYVINPETGRTIRKSGQAYKRWRRAHPTAPEPLTVNPNHSRRGVHNLPVIDTPTTQPSRCATSESRSTPRVHPRPTIDGFHRFQRSPVDQRSDSLAYPDHSFRPYVNEPSFRRSSLPVPHSSATRFASPRSGREPYHKHGMRSASPENLSWSRVRAPIAPSAVHPESDEVGRTHLLHHEYANNNKDDDDTRVIHQLLHEHGPTLLQAYQDPDVDFMQVLLDAYHQVTSIEHGLG